MKKKKKERRNTEFGKRFINIGLGKNAVAVMSVVEGP